MKFAFSTPSVLSWLLAATAGSLCAAGNPELYAPPIRPLHASYSVPALRGSARETAIVESLRTGAARPRLLATADLDRDGYPDLLCGYEAADGGGLLALHRGNPAAFAPAGEAALEAIALGRFPDSFLREALVMELPVAPEFFITGDFDRNGRVDALLAARGGFSLYLLTGDGSGILSAPRAIPLPGRLAALFPGGAGSAEDLPLSVVETSASDGPLRLVFDGVTGALSASPLGVPSPRAETAPDAGQPGLVATIDPGMAAGRTLGRTPALPVAGEPSQPAAGMLRARIHTPANEAALRELTRFLPGRPLAVLSMRLNVMAEPGLVVLAEGGGAPLLIPFLPMATFAVDRTDDTAAAAAQVCSGAASDCSLRGAILKANAAVGADLITLPAGTYTLTLANAGGTNEDAAATGDLDITDSLTITGAGAATTVIQGGTTNANGIDKVFGINPICDRVVNAAFSGITIRFGRNTQPFSAPDFSFTGGGLDWCGFSTGTFSFTSSVVTDNSNVNGYGGGINIDTVPGATGQITMTGMTISNNTAVNVGGGINVYGDDPVLVMNGSTLITGNKTLGTGGVGSQGGGINIRITNNAPATGSVSIDGATISGNTAHGVGGGVCVCGGGKQNVTIQNSSLTGNTSQDGLGLSARGGGLFTENPAGFTTTLTTVTITGNHADLGANGPFGGGIFNSTGTLSMNGGSVSGNTVGAANSQGSGGGVAVGGGAATLNGVNIQGNSAITAGGGLYMFQSGSLSANLCRIAGNTAASGTGATQLAGTLTANNNWWQCDGLPGAAGCQTATGTVTSTPRIDLRLLTSLATINVNQTSTLTANVNQNSAGTGITPTVLNGLTVTFASDAFGSVGPATQPIAGGTAVSTFTAGSTGGVSTVSATLDNGTQNATITINEPASVLTSPASATRCTGTSVSFSATARGYPAPTMQWQQSIDGGGTWPPVGGATSSPYSFTTALSQNGYQYRAVFTNTTGSPTTSGATLTVIDIPPTVGTSLRIGKSGSNAVFTWTDISYATDYGVYSDTAANGTFAIQAGMATSGSPGLTLPLAGASAFYKVAGRNICGVGTKN